MHISYLGAVWSFIICLMSPASGTLRQYSTTLVRDPQHQSPQHTLGMELGGGQCDRVCRLWAHLGTCQASMNGRLHSSEA